MPIKQVSFLINLHYHRLTSMTKVFIKNKEQVGLFQWKCNLYGIQPEQSLWPHSTTPTFMVSIGFVCFLFLFFVGISVACCSIRHHLNCTLTSERQTEGQTHMQTEGPSERQTNRLRQTEKKTNRQTKMNKYINEYT